MVRILKRKFLYLFGIFLFLLSFNFNCQSMDLEFDITDEQVKFIELTDFVPNWARNSAHYVGSYIPSMPSRRYFWPPTWIELIFKYTLVKPMFDATNDTCNETFDMGKSLQYVENAFKKEGPGGKAVKQAMDSFFRVVEEQFEKDKDDARVAQAINKFFDRVGDLFKDDGHGKKAWNDFIQMWRKELKKGEFRKLYKDFMEEWNKQVKEGGEFHDNFKKTEKLFIGGIENIGQAYDKVIDELGNTANKHYKKAVLLTTGCTIAVIASYYGSKLAYGYFDRKLKQPRLIIESSFKSFGQKLMGLFTQEVIQFRPMIFTQHVDEQLNTIVKATSNICKHIKQGKTNVKYRNLLLFGPPGTGKTMFARELAKKTSLPYVMITGSSFSQYKGGEGVKAMNELFSWAYKSNEGFILIIDEADSLLYDRNNMEPNSSEYQLLNNFLNWTGERNNKFMIILCANHKNKMDEAMSRRIDDYVYVPLPGEPERKKVLILYRDNILLDDKQNSKEFIDSVNKYLNDKKIEEIAERTEGLSNGDLEGIINTIKTDADIQDDGLVTNNLIDLVVNRAIIKYNALKHQKVIE